MLLGHNPGTIRFPLASTAWRYQRLLTSLSSPLLAQQQRGARPGQPRVELSRFERESYCRPHAVLNSSRNQSNPNGRHLSVLGTAILSTGVPMGLHICHDPVDLPGLEPGTFTLQGCCSTIGATGPNTVARGEHVPRTSVLFTLRVANTAACRPIGI